MFIDRFVVFVLASTLLFWLVGSFVVGFRQSKETNATRRAWLQLKLASIASVAVALVAGFALSSAPSLSTLSDPKVLGDTPLLLKHLQEYDRAMDWLKRAVGWLFLVLIFWFGPALFAFLRTLVPAANSDADAR